MKSPPDITPRFVDFRSKIIFYSCVLLHLTAADSMKLFFLLILFFFFFFLDSYSFSLLFSRGECNFRRPDLESSDCVSKEKGLKNNNNKSK